MTIPDELGSLVPPARLLGRLLVAEADASILRELERDDLRGALLELGIEVPPPDAQESLGIEYFEAFLHPTDGFPPIQSLWQNGQYDGDAAVSVRRIAAAAALEIAPGARGAPPDHIGCILLLWAELEGERRDLAECLRSDHLAWAPKALAPAIARGGFYGAVAKAAAALAQEIVG